MSQSENDDIFEEEEISPLQRLDGYVVPSGAARVKVTDEKGRVCWRKINEFASGRDCVILDNDGKPFFMKGSIGRPPKAPEFHDALPPVTPIVGDLIRIKQAQLRSDPIILTVESTPESPDVLNQVIEAIAEEAASLKFERLESERQGTDSSTLSMRRVQALKAIGDTWIKRKEQIQSRSVDLESPAFAALFTLICETFVRAMLGAGVRQELADSTMAAFSKMLDDSWKSDAKNRMKD